VCSEIWRTNSDAYEAGSIKAEVFSDGEEGEYPVPIKLTKIKIESEVSCFSVRWISQIQLSIVLQTLLQ
jgi:hypothetical protein